MNMRFLISLFLIVSIMGCTSQDKKTAGADNTSTPAMPKNFERVTPPGMMADPKQRANYMVTHFWDNFDFRDTMYCHAPNITERAFVDFLYIFPGASPEKISEGVKKLLTLAEVDVVMYNYFFKKAEHYLYNPNSSICNDEHFIPFLEHVVASEKLSDVHKIRPRHQLELAYKNRIGAKALDFTYTMASGRTGRMHDVSAEYMLLMFYNPDCIECKRTTDELKASANITAAISSGMLKVLSVYPDENISIWESHIKDIPSSWINGYDKSLDVKNKEIYDLKAIPTLYLLDKDKNVILKDTSAGAIHEYFGNNRR